MNFQKKLNDTGLSRRLNPGQLLGMVARKVNIGKRQKENAITRSALSLGDGSPFSLIKLSIENFQSHSKLTPDIFYKTALNTLLEYLDHAPQCDSHEKRVEIHHHYNSPSAVDQPTALSKDLEHKAQISTSGKKPKVKKNAPSETSVVVKHSADRASDETSPTTKSRTSRHRLRFSDSNLRTASSAPWKCPFDAPQCEICRTAWCRRYRCSRSDCKYEHLDGSHPTLNSVENRFVRGLHPESRAAKEDREDVPVPASPDYAPDFDSLKDFPQLSSPYKRRRSTSSECEVKRASTNITP